MKITKYKTYISKEDMILARTDDNKIIEILNKIDNYIHHLVNIIYNNYGLKHDASMTKEDIHCFCQMKIVISIRKYFHPERYDKKKDKNNVYHNGFTFIVDVGSKLVKHFWIHNHRKRRIPPEMVSSLNYNLNNNSDNEEFTIEDTLPATYNPNYELDIKKSIYSYYSKHNKVINGINLLDVVKDIIENDMEILELADKYFMQRQQMKNFIFENIVKPFLYKK